eukprot:gnl/TRDRNA2_/TRDRNA2_154194_c0_seq1.p1 gnl/TRDRNA2_/TRDRNA2_154194_c0~~gnl/TRDRNA2_/TRDRNA2_154194_c0_seq1.p1  ORF type:complete len:1053 (+),score=233.27 gnl/TRDRNA2_/TRDRNA2_154194_c0_seq1:314-3160(+)
MRTALNATAELHSALTQKCEGQFEHLQQSSIDNGAVESMCAAWRGGLHAEWLAETRQLAVELHQALDERVTDIEDVCRRSNAAFHSELAAELASRQMPREIVHRPHRPRSAKGRKHKREVDDQAHPIVDYDDEDAEYVGFDDGVPVQNQQRPPRPPSAKQRKHKRVADSSEHPTIYDDNDVEEDESPSQSEDGKNERLSPPNFQHRYAAASSSKPLPARLLATELVAAANAREEEARAHGLLKRDHAALADEVAKHSNVLQRLQAQLGDAELMCSSAWSGQQVMQYTEQMQVQKECTIKLEDAVRGLCHRDLPALRDRDENLRSDLLALREQVNQLHTGAEASAREFSSLQSSFCISEGERMRLTERTAEDQASLRAQHNRLVDQVQQMFIAEHDEHHQLLRHVSELQAGATSPAGLEQKLAKDMASLEMQHDRLVERVRLTAQAEQQQEYDQVRLLLQQASLLQESCREQTARMSEDSLHMKAQNARLVEQVERMCKAEHDEQHEQTATLAQRLAEITRVSKAGREEYQDLRARLDQVAELQESLPRRTASLETRLTEDRIAARSKHNHLVDEIARVAEAQHDEYQELRHSMQRTQAATEGQRTFHTVSENIGQQLKAELRETMDEVLDVQKAAFQKEKKRMGKWISEALAQQGQGAPLAPAEGLQTISNAAPVGGRWELAAYQLSEQLRLANQQVEELRRGEELERQEFLGDIRRTFEEQRDENFEVCRRAQDAVASAQAGMLATNLTGSFCEYDGLAQPLAAQAPSWSSPAPMEAVGLVAEAMMRTSGQAQQPAMQAWVPQQPQSPVPLEHAVPCGSYVTAPASPMWQQPMRTSPMSAGPRSRPTSAPLRRPAELHTSQSQPSLGAPSSARVRGRPQRGEASGGDPGGIWQSSLRSGDRPGTPPPPRNGVAALRQKLQRAQERDCEIQQDFCSYGSGMGCYGPGD